MQERFHLEYKAASPAEGLTEHELDHVFPGRFDGPFELNQDEVGAIRWVEPSELAQELETHPEHFTPWFKLAWEQVRDLL